MTSRRFAFFLLCGLIVCSPACNGRAPSSSGIPAAAGEDDGPALFRDITAESGLAFTYRNGVEAGHLSILESLGGGVALLDFDGDKRLDVFLPGGGYFEGKEIRGRPCKLYRNRGGGKFEEVSDRLHIDGWFYSHGAAVGDYDRDGWPDLLLTGWGRLALFHNEPVDPHDASKGRRLVDVAKQAGLTSQSWSSSAGWADFDGDGYPDLYICHYVNWSFSNHPSCGPPHDICPPKAFRGLPHKLFRNNRDGTFTDVSSEAPLRPGGPDASKGLGVLLVDVNSDGKPDIYVANDTADSFLYVNRCEKGKFRFEERGLVSGTARDVVSGSPNGSMGVDAADYDRSGRPSLFVTNYENELHALYHNECRGDRILFQSASRKAGIAALGQSTVGWGTGFLDLDRDGWEDLVVATGHAIRYPPRSGGDPHQRPILLRNKGGVFADVSREGGPYFRRTHLARGVALGDLDDDGRIDLVISHLNEPVVLLHNETATDNHWLGVELVGRDHADVVGARVILEAGGQTQTRFARGGGSYASSSDRRLVFGLGQATKIDRLTVVWPNGEKQQWDDLAIDSYHRLVEGQIPESPLPSNRSSK